MGDPQADTDLAASPSFDPAEFAYAFLEAFGNKRTTIKPFGGELEAHDVESGTIYVLRSLSDHPYVAQHRGIIPMMGVTGGKVDTRSANAENEATYLLAEVEVVATYRLAGINRTRMENLFHGLFAPARLNITINDRFGRPMQPEEWFLVPLFVVDEAVARIKDGSITGCFYDRNAAKLVRAKDSPSANCSTGRGA